MEILFLKSNFKIDDFSKKMFETLDLDYFKKDSLNAYKEIYYISKILGLEICLEYNSYDYEDEYNYMLTINKDVNSKLNISEIDITNFTIIVGKILSLTFNTEVVYEVNETLKIISPK